ncbi:MAG TPA: PDGLE domain-containing protein [Anaerolineae bacterium]|nr:PDGLE domain-containing protein [Anaerolineae bacterium]
MRNRTWWIVGLVIALAVTLVSPLASPWPDGLERVADDQGFSDAAEEPLYEIIPDYVLPGIPGESLATILAGVVGVLIVFGITLGAGYALRSRGPEGEAR